MKQGKDFFLRNNDATEKWGALSAVALTPVHSDPQTIIKLWWIDREG